MGTSDSVTASLEAELRALEAERESLVAPFDTAIDGIRTILDGLGVNGSGPKVKAVAPHDCLTITEDMSEAKQRATNNRRKLLRILYEAKEYSATQGQIVRRGRFASAGSVWHHEQGLTKEGFIERTGKRSRSPILSLTDKGQRRAAELFDYGWAPSIKAKAVADTAKQKKPYRTKGKNKKGNKRMRLAPTFPERKMHEKRNFLYGIIAERGPIQPKEIREAAINAKFNANPILDLIPTLLSEGQIVRIGKKGTPGVAYQVKQGDYVVVAGEQAPPYPGA